MYGAGGDDFDAGLRRVADDLFRSSEELQRTMEELRARTFEASSPDETVKFQVDGNNRVTAVVVDTQRSGRNPDDLDRLLTSALNEALAQAREQTREALLDALPARIRQSALEDHG